MPRSLAAGGAGFLGSHFVDELVAKDQGVQATDRSADACEELRSKGLVEG